MRAYTITSKAGRFVAGQRNRGVGTTIMLSERQAKFELEAGAIIDPSAPVTKNVKKAGKKRPDPEPVEPAQASDETSAADGTGDE